MREFSPNHYERAFENWLIDNGVEYVTADEHRNPAFARHKLKSFDFLLYPRSGQVILAEVKGRKFKGTSFEKLAGFECWVTTEDVEGLTKWQEVFGPDHKGVFVFAYKVENIDVDFDGREVFEFEARRYMFFAVRLDDYRNSMKRRSPKWQTVTLPAEKFRQCAVQIHEFLL
ncbi:MAG: HYExAFE family protein [Phycisphaerales bacterium]|nr:MAG: HYExAFE family protein [Phycisphaerales bacterium]